MKKWVLFVILLIIVTPIAHAEFIYPVEDRAHIFTREEIEALSGRLEALRNARKVWMVVETVRSSAPESLEKFANQQFAEKKIGTRAGNGILILIACDENKVRIEVGRGLEDRITDIKTHQIIDEKMIPQLKNKQPFQAILDATLAIDDLSIGYAPQESRSRETDPTSTYLILALLILIGIAWYPLGIQPLSKEIQKFGKISRVEPAQFQDESRKVLKGLKLSVITSTVAWTVLFWVYNELATGTAFRTDDADALARPILFGAFFCVIELVLLKFCVASAKSQILNWLYKHIDKSHVVSLKKYVNRRGFDTSGSDASLKISTDLISSDAHDRSAATPDPSTFGNGGDSNGGGSSGSF